MIDRGCLSVLVTAQYYYDLPKSLRSNLSACIIFNCTPRDWKQVQEETLYQSGELTKDQKQEITEIFATDNAFVYIDLDKSKIYSGFGGNIAEKRQTNVGEVKTKYRKLNPI